MSAPVGQNDHLLTNEHEKRWTMYELLQRRYTRLGKALLLSIMVNAVLLLLLIFWRR